MMKDEKYCNEADMHNASTSHGSQSNCVLRNFALKKPARRGFSLRVTYSVEAMPGLRTAPSVTIHN